MGVALLALRLVLAGVFAVAACAKLADRPGTRQAVEDLGAPARIAGVSALLVPLAELAIAGALVVPGTARWGAAGALALLAVFTLVVAVNLARGNAVDCNCFGRLRSEPIGATTLVRNGALCAVAALLLAFGWNAPGPSPVAWVGSLHGAWPVVLLLGVALVAVLGTGTWLAINLLRQNGRLLMRIDRLETALAEAGIEVAPAEAVAPGPGLPVGSAAPRFSLPGAKGGPVSLSELLRAERPVLLVFMDPECGPCEALAPEIARWQHEHAEAVTVAALLSGDREAATEKVRRHRLDHALLDPSRSVASAYRASATPAAALLSPRGVVSAQLAEGPDAIVELFDRSLVWDEPPGSGLPLGAAAPGVALEELDGGRVAVAERIAADRETLIVFWNPDCGFCQAIHDDLREWEEEAPRDRPALVVVSAGAADAVRAEGFTSPVLLDPDFEAAAAFEADGTPMAVLVGPDASIRSGLAAGGPDVLALAGARRAAAEVT